MFRINKGVFWLKLGYGLFAMGLYTVLPFLALQMSNQGLSDEDISFILGIMPLSLVFFHLSLACWETSLVTNTSFLPIVF